MNQRQSPLDQVLDLVVFAPLGLAVTIAEELPQMADKGRARLAQRTAVARMVGQLAVAEGGRGWGPSPPAGASASRPAPAGGPGPVSGGPAPAGGQGPLSGGPAPAGGPGPVSEGPGAPGPGRPATSARAARGSARTGPARTGVAGAGPGLSGAATGGRPAGEAGAPASRELAIPGYDSLSASQVVQRLASLSPAELDAVRRYEAANRGRRTILARVAQLQQG